MSFGQRDYDRTKPEIDFPGETPPTELVVEDLIEGSGPAVEAGSRVQVHYVGVAWSQPAMTWPMPSWNCSGAPRSQLASNCSPVEKDTPT